VDLLVLLRRQFIGVIEHRQAVGPPGRIFVYRHIDTPTFFWYSFGMRMTKDYKLVESPEEMDLVYYADHIGSLVFTYNEIVDFKINGNKADDFTEYLFISDKIITLQEIMTDNLNRDRMIKVTTREDAVLSAIEILESMNYLYSFGSDPELFNSEYCQRLVKYIAEWLAELIEKLEECTTSDN